MRFNLKERTFILFIVYIFIINLNNIIAAISNFQSLTYLIPVLTYILLLIISGVMLIIDKKKIAWIIAIISSILFLFNPLNPNAAAYSWGSFIALIQGIIWKDSITALLKLEMSLIPIMIIIYSFLELKNIKDRKLDINISKVFVILFIISLFFSNIILGTTKYIIPLITSIMYILGLFIWHKLDK